MIEKTWECVRAGGQISAFTLAAVLAVVTSPVWLPLAVVGFVAMRVWNYDPGVEYYD